MDAAVLRDRLAAVFVGSVLLACGMVTYGVLGGEDMLRAYPSRERHEGVYELAVPESELAALPGLDSDEGNGDFDGDGVTDELSVEYFHIEPLFKRSTSGLVEVRSGRTGQVLLAHLVDAAINRAWWYGDRDGNGTEDILVLDEGHRFVLGRR